MDTAFFASVRSSLFGGKLTQHQVDVLTAIFEAWAQYGDGDNRKLAYLLATAYHETGQFKWLREIWGPTPAQRRYEGKADLGNTVKGDGRRFMGRGLVHITGRRNYTDWAKRLGIDIVAQPELAERIDIAARILVQGCMLGTFTGVKLGDFINSAGTRYVNARKVVNGLDRAEDIAGYTAKFEDAIGDAPTKPAQPPKPAPAPTPSPSAPAQPKSPAAAIAALVIALAAGAYAFMKSNGVPQP